MEIDGFMFEINIRDGYICWVLVLCGLIVNDFRKCCLRIYVFGIVFWL